MTLAVRHSKLLRAFQRVVATLAVVSLLSATAFGCIHHAAHAGHHQVGATTQTKLSHASAVDHDASNLTAAASASALDVDPTSPSDHGDATDDCTHCGAAHCFACVMPTNASILMPWLVSKKGVAVGLFSAPSPMWRLERPPKKAL